MTRIPTEWRMVLIYSGLAIIVAAVFFYFGQMTKTRVETRTSIVKVTFKEQYGKPSASIPGAQINDALKGYACDIYKKPQMVWCH